MQGETSCIESPVLDLSGVDLGDLEVMADDALTRSLRHVLRTVDDSGMIASHSATPVSIGFDEDE